MSEKRWAKPTSFLTKNPQLKTLTKPNKHVILKKDFNLKNEGINMPAIIKAASRGGKGGVISFLVFKKRKKRFIVMVLVFNVLTKRFTGIKNYRKFTKNEIAQARANIRIELNRRNSGELMKGHVRKKFRLKFSFQPMSWNYINQWECGMKVCMYRSGGTIQVAISTEDEVVQGSVRVVESHEGRSSIPEDGNPEFTKIFSASLASPHARRAKDIRGKARSIKDGSTVEMAL